MLAIVYFWKVLDPISLLPLRLTSNNPDLLTKAFSKSTLAKLRPKAYNRSKTPFYPTHQSPVEKKRQLGFTYMREPYYTSHRQSSITCFITIAFTKTNIPFKHTSDQHHQSYLIYHVNITKQIKQVKPEKNSKSETLCDPYFQLQTFLIQQPLLTKQIIMFTFHVIQQKQLSKIITQFRVTQHQLNELTPNNHKVFFFKLGFDIKV